MTARIPIRLHGKIRERSKQKADRKNGCKIRAMDERMRACQSNEKSDFKWINSGLPAMGISAARKTMHIYPADGGIESPSLLIVATIPNRRRIACQILFSISSFKQALCAYEIITVLCLYLMRIKSCFCCPSKFNLRHFFIDCLALFFSPFHSIVCLAAKNAYSWIHHLWAD